MNTAKTVGIVSLSVAGLYMWYRYQSIKAKLEKLFLEIDGIMPKLIKGKALVAPILKIHNPFSFPLPVKIDAVQVIKNNVILAQSYSPLTLTLKPGDNKSSELYFKTNFKKLLSNLLDGDSIEIKVKLGWLGVYLNKRIVISQSELIKNHVQF